MTSKRQRGRYYYKLIDDELQACAPNILVASLSRVIVPAFNLNMSKELEKKVLKLL